MDKRVLDRPYILRALLVKGIILNTRPKKSAAAYSKIWTKDGSPLIVWSERLKRAFQEKQDLPVALAMRYGSMSIRKGMRELSKQGVTEVLLVPLYPHHAMSSTETVIEKVREVRDRYEKHLSIEVLPAFYKEKAYMDALTRSIADVLKPIEVDHVLFSYHGLPERHIRKTDVTSGHCKIDGTCCITPSPAHAFCYRHQCLETTRTITSQLELDPAQVTTSFQSRLGRDPWLLPNSTDVLENLARSGVKHVAVASPSFVADCLETLEEMEMENRELFLKAGGESFHFIPCLNVNDDWVSALALWTENWKEGQLKTFAVT
jgi:ferrochelatase